MMMTHPERPNAHPNVTEGCQSAATWVFTRPNTWPIELHVLVARARRLANNRIPVLYPTRRYSRTSGIFLHLPVLQTR